MTIWSMYDYMIYDYMIYYYMIYVRLYDLWNIFLLIIDVF